MIDRRTFLKTVGSAGAVLALNPHDLLGRAVGTSYVYFGVHPFIENHPDAVFILRTSVDSKLNAAAKKQVGISFGNSVFLSMPTPGYPFTSKVAIKPNLTSVPLSHPSYTPEAAMGILTDVYFVEGLIESMKGLGLKGGQFYIREANGPSSFGDSGYYAMATRTGVDLRDLSGSVGSLPPGSIQWVDVPNGVWYSRIAYLWPVNAPDSLLINIGKLKAHTMCITLCAKNIQGTNCRGYVAHCTKYGLTMNVNSAHIRPNANAVILANYNAHVAQGIPRWDRPGDTGGIRMETWATRCLDNNSVTQPALHIVEGIYGRDGHFMDGPSPEGLATDYMTNMIIFGKNPFAVDIIGHWLAGHEPGNLGLFHMAIERGLSDVLDPMKIPVYEWTTDGTATLTPLTSFPRTPLRTNYLRRDYGGQSEDLWHLVNEPYQYPNDVATRNDLRPQRFMLHQNFPNPFNGTTTVEFALPMEGNVRIDVFDVHGRIVDVLVERHLPRGAHMVHWDGNRSASGVYFCRMLFGGMKEVRSMVLLR